MATAYRAWDHRAACDVVVKIPHPVLMLDHGFAERFKREAQSLVLHRIAEKNRGQYRTERFRRPVSGQ